MIITKKHAVSEFGSILKDKMADKKVSMTGLGKIVGVHRTTISDYILGKHLPKEETFHRIHQVFPDKDLYDAYFSAVKETEPRKNKQIIPEVSSYNYYAAENTKAAECIAKKLYEADKIIKQNVSDDVYIAIALREMINRFEQSGMDKFAPKDYAAYKKLYESYTSK